MSRRRRDIENDSIIHDIFASIVNCSSTSVRTWQKTQFALLAKKKLKENIINHNHPSRGHEGPEGE